MAPARGHAREDDTGDHQAVEQYVLYKNSEPPPRSAPTPAPSPRSAAVTGAGDARLDRGPTHPSSCRNRRRQLSAG